MTASEGADVVQRLKALEAGIAAKQTELDQYKAELESLKRVLAITDTQNPTPSPQPTVVAEGICRSQSIVDYDLVMKDPRGLQSCAVVQTVEGGVQTSTTITALGQPKDRNVQFLKSSDVEQEAGNRLARRATSGIPNRSNLAPGLTTDLEFSGAGGRAGISLTKPFTIRTSAWDKTNGSFISYRPHLINLTGGLSVPITKGVGNLFSGKERVKRKDLDVLGGTTVKIGVDFLSFRKFKRGDSFLRVAAFLYEARKKCLVSEPKAGDKDNFYQKSGFEKKGEDNYGIEIWEPKKFEDYDGIEGINEKCAGDALTDYIFATKPDPKNAKLKLFKNPELAAGYQAIFWQDENAKAAIPRFGLGASVEFGTNDFKYSPGTINEKIDATTGKTSLELDRTIALGKSTTDSEQDWKIEGYGSIFVANVNGDNERQRKMYTKGVMLLGSVAYTSSYEFRSGTSDISVCPLTPVTDILGQCSTLNVAAPAKRDAFSLSAEARFQFENVPILGVLGFGPKYTHRLEDEAKLVDFPIYLSDKDGLGSAGIRLKHAWDGEDILGNNEQSDTSVSIFWNSPINFRGL